MTRLEKPNKPLVFRNEEVAKAVKDFKRKKCFGIDGVPQVILKDVYDNLSIGITTLFNDFALNGLPD